MAIFVNCMNVCGIAAIPPAFLEKIPYILMVIILIITIIVAYVQWWGKEKIKAVMNNESKRSKTPP